MTSIAFIGNFDSPIYRTDESRLADALERQGAEVLRIGYPWTGLDRLVRSTEIDWLLFSKCRQLSGRRFDKLIQSARPRLAQVLFDLMDYRERRIRGVPVMRNRLQWWLPMAAKFDIVFSKELGNFDRYGMHGVNCIYLDQAVDPMEMPLESTSARKTTDIAFFGRWTPNRQESLSQISGNAQVTTYSVRPNAWRRSAFRSLAHVDGVEFAQAVSSARVIWGESATHDVAGYWSDRRYKVMGRGGTFVTRYTEGIDKAFTNNENILWYRSLEEAEDLVHSLLQDEPRIASIGVEAARHVHTNHTYDHRAAEMLQVLTA